MQRWLSGGLLGGLFRWAAAGSALRTPVWLTQRELEISDRFFARFGSATVFVARLLPVIRTFIALPAGVARMPQVRFHVYTFLGSWPWCFALAYLGMKAGEQQRETRKWDLPVMHYG